MIGGKQCEAVTRTPKHDETFKIGQGITVKALHTPCHTQDSICWLMEDGNDRVVFTGDTLFIGGTETRPPRRPIANSYRKAVGASLKGLQKKCIQPSIRP